MKVVNVGHDPIKTAININGAGHVDPNGQATVLTDLERGLHDRKPDKCDANGRKDHKRVGILYPGLASVFIYTDKIDRIAKMKQKIRSIALGVAALLACTNLHGAATDEAVRVISVDVREKSGGR